MGGLGVTIALGMVPQFYEFRRFRVIGIIWLVAAALADVLITGALVWHLVRSDKLPLMKLLH